MVAVVACGAFITLALHQPLHQPQLPGPLARAAVQARAPPLVPPPALRRTHQHDAARLSRLTMRAGVRSDEVAAAGARLGRGARIRGLVRKLAFGLALVTSLRLSPARAVVDGPDAAPTTTVSAEAGPAARSMAARAGGLNQWTRLRLRRRGSADEVAAAGTVGRARTAPATTLVASRGKQTTAPMGGSLVNPNPDPVNMPSPREIAERCIQTVRDIDSHVAPAERDAVVVLGVSALVPPLMNYVKLSPVLGFLFAGILVGPSGFGLVSDVATTTKLAELGVVFFLFEM